MSYTCAPRMFSLLYGRGTITHLLYSIFKTQAKKKPKNNRCFHIGVFHSSFFWSQLRLLTPTIVRVDGTTDVTWTILAMSLHCFWALNVSVSLLSMQGQKALRFHQTYLNFCSEDEWRTYGFGTTWGRVIIVSFHFWVNYPFNYLKCSSVRSWFATNIFCSFLSLFFLFSLANTDATVYNFLFFFPFVISQ